MPVPPPIAFSHLPVPCVPFVVSPPGATKPITKIIFQHRQSRCRHFIGALNNIFNLNILHNILLAMQWENNDNHSTMWFVENPCTCYYKYSKYNISPKPYFAELKLLANFVEKLTGSDETNCVNINYYEDQFSSVGYHSDSEDLFQAETIFSTIISVSIGATRTFSIKAKDRSEEFFRDLDHGDVLTMEGLCQKFYLHALLRSPGACGYRINLTFRKIVQHKQYCPLANE